MTRRCLYKWRTRLEAVEQGEEAARPGTHASAHRKEILQLKRLLADKAMEVDFLKGALQKVEARRRRSSGFQTQTAPISPVTAPLLKIVSTDGETREVNATDLGRDAQVRIFRNKAIQYSSRGLMHLLTRLAGDFQDDTIGGGQLGIVVGRVMVTFTWPTPLM